MSLIKAMSKVFIIVEVVSKSEDSLTISDVFNTFEEAEAKLNYLNNLDIMSSLWPREPLFKIIEMPIIPLPKYITNNLFLFGYAVEEEPYIGVVDDYWAKNQEKEEGVVFKVDNFNYSHFVWAKSLVEASEYFTLSGL